MMKSILHISVMGLIGWGIQVGGSQPLAAAEIEVPYSVLAGSIIKNNFTDQGRHYLSGDSGSKCTYAYLENPRVIAESGRLKLVAHFSGRAATEVFGNCVGAGDAFTVTLSGVPVYADGELRLDDQRIDVPDGKLFSDEIEDFLSGNLLPAFRYPLRDEIRKALASVKIENGSLELGRFEISRLALGSDRVVAIFDFAVKVR
jgi:hypothetical protein